ncbi:hypothetical protein [Leucobacter tenebrionis]|nr:hypothetical protein [Leucobacter tenebrionis]
MSSHGKPIPCVRCGIPRTPGSNIKALCRDCSAVLTAPELEAWAA